MVACSSLLHHDQRAWAADAAPNSEELVWANLGSAPALQRHSLCTCANAYAYAAALQLHFSLMLVQCSGICMPVLPCFSATESCSATCVLQL